MVLIKASTQQTIHWITCYVDEMTALNDVLVYLKLEEQKTDAVDALMANLKPQPTHPQETCVSPSGGAFAALGLDVQKMPKRVRDEVAVWEADFATATAPIKMSTAKVIGLTGKVGYETHTWYDGTTLGKTNDHRTPWSVGAYFTYIPSGWKWAATLKYDYQRSYSDSDTKTLCPSGTGVLTCVSGPSANRNEQPAIF